MNGVILLNEMLKVIHKRRSVRAYSDKPVTWEEKDQILNATFQAPTAGQPDALFRHRGRRLGNQGPLRGHL